MIEHIDAIAAGGNFVLGTMTVLLSVYACARFHAFRVALRGNAGKLSYAIAWQLLGEAVIGFGTLMFATAAHFGWLDNWSDWFQSAIRFVMFFATSATTLHLVKTIEKLE